MRYNSVCSTFSPVSRHVKLREIPVFSAAKETVEWYLDWRDSWTVRDRKFKASARGEKRVGIRLTVEASLV